MPLLFLVNYSKLMSLFPVISFGQRQYISENRLINVLTYICFLELGLDLDEKQIEEESMQMTRLVGEN